MMFFLENVSSTLIMNCFFKKSEIVQICKNYKSDEKTDFFRKKNAFIV